MESELFLEIPRAREELINELIRIGVLKVSEDGRLTTV